MKKKIFRLSFIFSLTLAGLLSAQNSEASVVVDRAWIDGLATSYCIPTSGRKPGCDAEFSACQTAVNYKMSNIVGAYCSGINPELCTAHGGDVYEFSNQGYGHVQSSLDLFFFTEETIKAALNCEGRKPTDTVLIGGYGHVVGGFQEEITVVDILRAPKRVINVIGDDRVTDIPVVVPPAPAEPVQNPPSPPAPLPEPSVTNETDSQNKAEEPKLPAPVEIGEAPGMEKTPDQNQGSNGTAVLDNPSIVNERAPSASIGNEEPDTQGAQEMGVIGCSFQAVGAGSIDPSYLIAFLGLAGTAFLKKIRSKK